jgi:hypothetical protein
MEAEKMMIVETSRKKQKSKIIKIIKIILP